jgi:SAM-dependent methyltransferase
MALSHPAQNSVCPSCGNTELSVFYEIDQVPVHSCLMLSSREEALDFPCGDLRLAFCDRCGFITNLLFDSQWSAYASNYEDQQSFSPTFSKFAQELASTLVDKYNLQNKDIVEIGCSKGDFLLLLCELGHNRGVGIDPSVLPGRVQSEAADRVRFIQDYYSDKHAQYVGDFICCRHTLEHIQPVATFMQTVRRSIGDRSDVVVVFEIPDTVRVLKDLAFEDIYYEHSSYFTPGSLARLFRQSGFKITDLYRAYGDQYLLVEALPAQEIQDQTHPLEESLDELTQYVNYFQQHIEAKLQHWQAHLDAACEQKQKVVVWGSGSKCVSFFTTLRVDEQIQYVVDINPYRQGKFIPGVGKEIMAPEFLKTYQPDQIIVMNAIYQVEISKMLKEMGVSAQIYCL